MKTVTAKEFQTVFHDETRTNNTKETRMQLTLLRLETQWKALISAGPSLIYSSPLWKHPEEAVHDEPSILWKKAWNKG
jgi:hypothetical protein